MSHFISRPTTALKGEITVPGDKSISHRAIILGAISQGITTVTGFLEGEDCLATLGAFQSMGVKIEGPVGQRVRIHGVGKYGLKPPQGVIDCGNSGTTMRLMAGLLAAQSFESELTGDHSLLKRPMARVSQPLQQMGAQVNTSVGGKPPLLIRGGHVLHGISYTTPIASAQVKSCLLLAGLYAQGKTCVIEPEITRNHTELMLKAFSFPVHQSDRMVCIEGAGEGQGIDIVVPGDISSAAFFIVATTLIPGSNVLIKNVGMNPTRTGIIHILKQMGADISSVNQRLYGAEPVADLIVRHAPLSGIDIPLEMVSLAIDEFPVIFIAASCAKGQTTLRGAKELRLKESDRIGAMVDGLVSLGIKAEALEDGAIIEGGTIGGGTVESYHDHRIAMAFAIAGGVATAPIFIKDCANVATSFPTFITTAKQVGLNLQDS